MGFYAHYPLSDLSAGYLEKKPREIFPFISVTYAKCKGYMNEHLFNDKKLISE
jgi:hypothetical protein